MKANVVRLHKNLRAAEAAAADKYPDHPYFFHKGQIKVGTRLRYIGRTAPGLVFTVTGITSWLKEGKDYYERNVTAAYRTDDKITVKRGNDVRVMTFSYLSYSAIWSIADEGQIHARD